MEKNFDNIRSSFAELIKHIKAKGIDKSILVIAGDIFEHKSSLTIDEIYLFKEICKNINESKIRTIMIPGNHDYNINSYLAKDSVSILYFGDYIACYNETRIIEEPDIDFYIFSPIDKKIPEFKKSDKISIAILHEAINAATYDNGEVISNGRFTANDLKRFDYVMLGDIHKPQFLTPTIAYPGSFVQKNKGEGLDHGYILWNLCDKTGEHVFIPLPQVYLKLEAANDTCELPELGLEQKVRYISFSYSDCSTGYLAKIKDTIKSKYGFINRISAPIKNIQGQAIILNKDSIQEKIQVNHTNIIRQILKDNNKENMVERILEFHAKNLQENKEMEFTSYKLNYLVWNNVYCYGEDNYINFADLKNDLTVLNGNNKDGKSAIIDILIRVLFNESIRGSKADIVNKSKTNGNIKLSFSIGADEYIIELLFFRKDKSKIPHRLLKNGENITQDTIPSTYAYLSKFIGIGSYKDFINMTTALQNRSYLVDLNNAESKSFINLLTKITNIDILKSIEDTVKKEKTELKSSTRQYEKDITKIKEVSKQELDGLEEKLRLAKLNKEENIVQIKELNTTLNDLNKKYIEIKIPENLDKTISNLESQIKYLQKPELEFNIEQEILECKVLENKLSIVNERDLSRILQTDYSSIDNVDRDSIVKEIQSLSFKTTEPTYEVIESKDEIEKTIQIGPDNRDMKPLIKCEINNLLELAYSSEEYMAATLQQGLIEANHINLMERTAIDKPSYYDKYDKYKEFVSNGLPDYNDIQIILNNHKKDITPKLHFNKTCKECKANDKIIASYINNLERAIADKEATINKFDSYNQKIKTIEEYNQYTLYKEYSELKKKNKEYKYAKEQNEIYISNVETTEENNLIIQRNKNYNHAIELLKQINNKENWDKLVSLKAMHKQIKESSIQLDKLAYDNKYRNVKYYTVETDLKRCLELRRIDETNMIYEFDINAAEINVLEKQNILSLIENDILDITKVYTGDKNKYDQKYVIQTSIAKNLERLEFIETYLSTIDYKTGIPSHVLRNVCELIKDNCNDILQKITDFTIDIDFDKDINIYTVENGFRIPAEMASGFQKFILDMIIRITLTQISNVSNPNMLFIDEGFGSLDKENFTNVSNVLNKLKLNFDAMIIITHIQELKAFADKTISITKNNNLSQLSFGHLTDVQKVFTLIHDKDMENKNNKEFREQTKASSSNQNKAQIQEIIADNNGLAEILIDINGARFTCKACNKDFVVKRNAIENHINAATHRKKHDKYINEFRK